jgi:putative DNA primase/helicase
MARNLDDVIRQMADRGCKPPASVDLEKAFHGYVRFRPEGDKRPKKSGWVRLFVFKSKSGKEYVVGAFGNRGDTFQVEPEDTEWSPAERAQYIEDKKAAAKAAQAERAQDHATAAEKAARMWKKGRDLDEGAVVHPYLKAKQVGAFGLRIGFNDRLMVPLRDVQGALHGLQYISPEGEKIFGTATNTEAMSHLVGELGPQVKVLAFGEGYATCATVHMATGWPLVVAFNAGNLGPVVGAYRRLYPQLQFVIAADDDRHLLQRLSDRLAKHGITCSPDELRESMDRDWSIPGGQDVVLLAGWRGDSVGVMRIEGTLTLGGKEQPLLIENAGQAKAHAAAKKHGARVLTPVFADRESRGTDWNDLHCALGLERVRDLIAAAMEAEPEKPRANARAHRADKGRGGKGSEGGSGKGKQPPAQREGELPMMERFVLIYGTTTVWDQQVRDIVPLAALGAAFGKDADWWLAQSDRLMVPRENVVFDPTGACQLPRYVNLFDKLPVEPQEGECSTIVRHIFNLCQENLALFEWVIRWLAYPLQNPGAKMRTALVLHGRTEGTGKTKLGQIMRRIYGRYATSVGQPELQRDFNDWMSAKLLILAEEVVSRADRAHHQGMLQNLITNDRVQINTKNMPIREEANHANFIFFSNVQIPMLLNKKDRRYTVIRVEREHPADYFAAIDRELDNGGAEAFLHYLLNFQMDGFNEYTRPFENRDRMQLITLGMAPDQRFFQFWSSGYAGVPFCCCAGSDLYMAFKAWCRVNGERFVPTLTQWGRTMSEELEAIGAPEKRSKRYLAYSDKQISEGDFGEASPSQTHKQGVVYFVPAHLEVMGPPEEDARRQQPADDQAQALDVTQSTYFNAKIKLFQVQLHELMASARRSV